MSCQIHRCCFFNNSQDASFASGVYTAILTLISIVYTGVSFSYVLNQDVEIRFSDTRIIIFIVAFVIQIAFFIFSLLLMYGVKKGNRFYMIPWMIWMLIDIVLQLISICLILIALFSSMTPVLLIYLLIISTTNGLNITCLIVVKTHYQVLTGIISNSNNVEPPPSYQKIVISTPQYDSIFTDKTMLI